MQMAAVVKLAVRHVRFEIGHVSGQLPWVNVVQAKLLKAGGVNQCRGFVCIHPIPSGAGGGVFAAVQGLRQDASLHQCTWNQAVDQTAFARARRAQHQRGSPRQACGQGGSAGVFVFQRQGHHVIAHVPVGQQPLPSPRKRHGQITFVEGNQRRDVLLFCGNQGA